MIVVEDVDDGTAYDHRPCEERVRTINVDLKVGGRNMWASIGHQWSRKIRDDDRNHTCMDLIWLCCIYAKGDLGKNSFNYDCIINKYAYLVEWIGWRIPKWGMVEVEILRHIRLVKI